MIKIIFTLNLKIIRYFFHNLFQIYYAISINERI